MLEKVPSLAEAQMFAAQGSTGAGLGLGELTTGRASRSRFAGTLGEVRPVNTMW